MWWHESANGERLMCDLCPRHCALRPGERGFCFVRENRDGRIVSTTYGRSTGFCVDPIEKKPLHQFHPGTPVLSFGTAGCNLGCVFCQNWTSSRSRDVDVACESASPEAIAAAARQTGCRSVAFTYNDPIIWAEYAIDTARACHAVGVKTVAVTNGYITAEARADFFAEIDAANVDLKGFTDQFYRDYCGGRLQPVLDTLRWLIRETQTWVEITNLIIPGANDSPEEIKDMCRWIAAELRPDVPIHFSAFHPTFELTDRPPTPPDTLRMAYETARAAGLHYVYVGNVHDPEYQHTYCPGCGRAVIRRMGYEIAGYEIGDGRCTNCGAEIAGRFDNAPGTWGNRRMPIRIEN
ncbi:MAG: AmmeMemoRadiSam system radical SAM enzyme [Pirellulales bacterium]|nr:AmmeMemoRadiSam system radical SAM enzyme [Pirellulales bacterium]